MHINDLLSAVLIGLVVGVLGRLVLPGRQRIGVISTLVVGTLAALLGSFVARQFNVDDGVNASLAFINLDGIKWDWIELAIQVGFAVIGIALANMITYTSLADRGNAPAKKRRKRSKSSS